MAANPTIVFTGPRAVAVEDLPSPDPQAGEVLIRTHCTQISIGTELAVLEGDAPGGETWREMRQYPYVAGYSNTGTIVAVGEGVSADWIGARVASWGPHGALVCVAADRCWRLPDSVSDEAGTFLSLAHVALHGMRRSGLVFGESAVVFGLGIVGQITAQLCRFAGVRPTVCVDAAAARLDKLPEDPALFPVNATEQDVAAAVREATRGRMADVVFEATGNGDLIPGELAALHNEGRCVIVSSPRQATLFDFHDLCNRPSYTIIGAHNWSHPMHATPQNPWTWERHTELYADLLASGALDVDRLVTHRVTVDETPELYARLLQDRTQALGVLISWPNGPAAGGSRS